MPGKGEAVNQLLEAIMSLKYLLNRFEDEHPVFRCGALCI